MIFLPQLSSGASVQFPVQKNIKYRTITNSLEDGSQIKLVDFDAFSIAWQVVYSGISDQELRDLLTFFESVEGRLLPFIFFDPSSNLLGWSESLTQPSWQYNSLLAVTSLPFGSNGIQHGYQLANSTGGDLSLAQEISIPGSYVSTFSLYARSDTRQNLIIQRTSGDCEAHRKLIIGTSWNRYTLTSDLDSGAESSIFSILLGPDITIDIFGLQVDAQPFASPYIESIDKGGIYENAHFDMDEIQFASIGPNCNSCTLYITVPTVHANNL